MQFQFLFVAFLCLGFSFIQLASCGRFIAGQRVTPAASSSSYQWEHHPPCLKPELRGTYEKQMASLDVTKDKHKLEELLQPNTTCRFCKPGDYNGTLLGAAYQVRIPKNWNRVLIIFARGYSYDIPAPEAFPGGPLVEQQILDAGYAIAGSAFSAGGWAIPQGIKDSVTLAGFLRLWGCFPRHTIIFGVSMGSVVALKSIETIPFIFNGAIAGCAVGAGSTRTFDLSLMWNLAYDGGFSVNGTGGWPPSWGTVQNPPYPIDFATDVEPFLFEEILDPFLFPFFEFLRMVTKSPSDQFYDGSNWLFTDFYFSTQALAQINHQMGGVVTQNKGVTYSLTPDQIAELRNTYGVDATPLLAYMNSHNTYTADLKARLFLALIGDYTGRILGPVITLHNQVDGLVPVESESAYKDTVEAAGKGKHLFQVYANGVGHCAFSGDQLLTTVNAMHSWLAKRKKPTLDDFPTEQGFLRDFQPGPWPY